MLLPRVLTAIIGIPLILIVIYAGGFPFYLFVMFVIIVGLWEYYVMMRLALKPLDIFSLFLFGFIFPTVFFLNGTHHSNIYNFLPFFISLGIILPFISELFRKEKYMERIVYTLIGIFFISYNLSYLIMIREIKPDGMKLILWTIICVWIGDTMAYFVGLKFGKNRLNEISPKKTIEGFVASLVSSIIFFLILAKYSSYLSKFQFIILGIIISLAGQFSDLAESLIKRACGVKDSSNILPGHGGFLDRFDSYIFVAPFVYYFIIFVKN